MKFAAAALFAFAALAATGCGPIKYGNPIERVGGRRVFVEQPKITNCHAELDKAATETEIKKSAEELLTHYGYQVVMDPDSADLVLRADVLDFSMGNTAARVLIGGGQAWHDTIVLIKPKGHTDNTGHRRAEVSAGAYSNWKGAEAHRRAVVNEIGKMHVWIAQKYCP
ncbi:MAG: hypothetical protein FD180_1437 [Planctomycetota bacterium]|nr:MAG: hypothetical protein FD180_1437 [Planctomycetota bacterium]